MKKNNVIILQILCFLSINIVLFKIANALMVVWLLTKKENDNYTKK